MWRGLRSFYAWQYPVALAYMLQSTEYHVSAYVRWFWRTNDFSRVTYRRTLHRTAPARLVVLLLRLGIAVQIIIGLSLIFLWYQRGMTGGLAFGLALVLSYPLVWAHLVVLPIAVGEVFIIRPRQQRLIAASERIFKDHPGAKIAIAGSYGKTSMKELLLTVLGERKIVAATPANKNVAISHAYFAQKLTGREDILLIEYGEGAPGDVAAFARVTHPTHAVITGIAPAHLDRYKTVERAADDIFSVADAVAADQVYANAESPYIDTLLAKNAAFQGYDQKGALGWNVSDVRIAITGTAFTLTKGRTKLQLHSQLLGRHQIGPVAFAAALAHTFGMQPNHITNAVAKTMPFEHRMQPYQLSGAWIIDDTYNGNLEGVRAGTALLKELPAKRKIYVTPGLVDQGKASDEVHQEVGALIAAAKPDIVVLMQNSAKNAITKGLEQAAYQGEIIIEDDPLDFYTNLQAFVANGDVVLMQNDWTDNYN